MDLAFVGDIALGDHPKAVGFGFHSRYADGIPPDRSSRLVPPGPRPDVFFGNLEFPLGLEPGTAGTAGQLQCRGLDAYAGFLAGAGVTVLNVANNHTAQHGASGFEHTVALLRASGIHVVGTPADFTEDGVLRVGERRVACLGWSDRPRQYAPERPRYNEFSQSAFAHIANATTRADVVIASIHWGDEFILVPSDRERTIARAMIDAGATVVIGHHPHVPRGVERYGNGLIAYSLGNFVCDMAWDYRTRMTGWLTASVDGGQPESWQFIPGVIADDYFPRPATSASDLRLLRKLARATAAQASRVARTGYPRVATAEGRRHSLRTAWMMLRHAHRYPPGMAREAFGGALSHRIARLLARGRPGE